jgi:hypothetical protein
MAGRPPKMKYAFLVRPDGAASTVMAVGTPHLDGCNVWIRSNQEITCYFVGLDLLPVLQPGLVFVNGVISGITDMEKIDVFARNLHFEGLLELTDDHIPESSLEYPEISGEYYLKYRYGNIEILLPATAFLMPMVFVDSHFVNRFQSGTLASQGNLYYEYRWEPGRLVIAFNGRFHLCISRAVAEATADYLRFPEVRNYYDAAYWAYHKETYLKEPIPQPPDTFLKLRLYGHQYGQTFVVIRVEITTPFCPKGHVLFTPIGTPRGKQKKDKPKKTHMAEGQVFSETIIGKKCGKKSSPYRVGVIKQRTYKSFAEMMMSKQPKEVTEHQIIVENGEAQFSFVSRRKEKGHLMELQPDDMDIETPALLPGFEAFLYAVKFLKQYSIYPLSWTPYYAEGTQGQPDSVPECIVVSIITGHVTWLVFEFSDHQCTLMTPTSVAHSAATIDDMRMIFKREGCWHKGDALSDGSEVRTLKHYVQRSPQRWAKLILKKCT